MSKMRTSIVMQLVDRVTSPVRRIQQSLSGLSRRAGLDRLGRSARQVGAQMRIATTEAGRLGANLFKLGALGAAGAWGATRMVQAYTEPTDLAVKLSRRLSMSFDDMQRLIGASSRMTSLGSDEMGANLEMFERRLGEAAAGVGEAAKAYAWAGIDLRDSNGNVRSSVDLMMDVADKMANIDHEAMRQRFATALFGRSGSGMIDMLAEGRKGIEAEIALWEQSGQMITEEDAILAEEFNTNLGHLTGTIRGLRNRIASGLVPAMNDWFVRIIELTQANRDLISVKVHEALQRAWSAITAVGRTVSRAAEFVGGFGNLALWVAGIMAGRFLMSVFLAAAAFVKLAKDVALVAVRISFFLVRGVVLATRHLLVFAARGVMGAATSLVSLSRGLIGLAARAIPAAIMGIRAMSLALLTTPVGWIITGITAVAGIAVLLYRNWDGVAAWFGSMWEGVKAFFTQSPGEIARQLLSFTPAGMIYRHWSGISAWFGRMWEGVKTFFAQGSGEIARQLFSFTPVGMIYRHWDGIAAWFGDMWAGVKAFFDGGIGDITKNLLAFSPAGLLGQGIDAVFNLFGTKTLTETGSQWVGGLWDGIRERWGQLTGWLRTSVADLTSWMPDWAKDRLGLSSMSAPAAGGSPEAALGAPVASGGALGAASQRNRVDVGGNLKIQVDSEGRASVKEARSRGGMGFDVDSGVLGVAG